jgi:hypothetical protein
MNTDTIGNHVDTRTQSTITWTHMNADTIDNHVDTHEHGHNRQSRGHT